MTQKLKEKASQQARIDLERLERDQYVVAQLKLKLQEAEQQLAISRQTSQESLKKMKRLYEMEETKSEFKIV